MRDERAIPSVPLLEGLRGMRRDRFGHLLSLQSRFGEICTMSIGTHEAVFVTDPELAHAVLVEQESKTVKSRGLRVFARPLLGDGLLSTAGARHRRQRRLIAPALAHGRIAGYATAMARHAEIAAAGWRHGRVVDLAEEMMRLTLGIVAETLFSTRVSDEAAEIGEALTVANRWLIDEVTSLVHFPLSWPTPRNVRARRAIARLDATIFRLVSERRASGRDEGDVLSMLLAARDADDGSAMRDAEVRDEVMTIMLAGHETTANALAWTFHLLGQHPEIAREVRVEVDAALAGRSPTFEDLPRLPLCLAVVKEAMRLYPPAYFVGREATEPLQLGQHELRAGRLVFVNIAGIHRRPDLHPEPERFSPGRFLGGAEKSLHRMSYLPFGAGPRVCIGNHFALMEAQVLLATLAQRVRLEPAYVGGVEVEPLVTLRPRGGLPMRVERRGASDRSADRRAGGADEVRHAV